MNVFQVYGNDDISYCSKVVSNQPLKTKHHEPFCMIVAVRLVSVTDVRWTVMGRKKRILWCKGLPTLELPLFIRRECVVNAPEFVIKVYIESITWEVLPWQRPLPPTWRYIFVIIWSVTIAWHMVAESDTALELCLKYHQHHYLALRTMNNKPAKDRPCSGKEWCWRARVVCLIRQISITARSLLVCSPLDPA